MANYWDNFTHALSALGSRYLEESGINDVFEELARINDPGSNPLSMMNNIMDAGVQGITAPLQGLGNLAIEADRAAGAAILGGMKGWSTLAKTGSPTEMWKAGIQPWNTYATEWTPPQDVVTDDGSIKQSQGIYGGGTLGDLIIVGQDHLVAALGQGVRLSPLYGAYNLGTIGKEPGKFSNQSYLPTAFDIYSPDVGAQLSNTELATAAMLSQFATEAVIDPLNYIAGPIGRLVAMRNSVGIVAKGGESATTVAGILGEANAALVGRRMNQARTGLGLIDQQGIVNYLASKRGSEMLEFLAKNTDSAEAEAFFRRNGLADGEAANELGKLTAGISDREGIAHLLNAAAFRNRESIDIVRDAVSDSTPLENAFRSLTDTGENLLDRSLIEFPNGSILPDGHIMQVSARQFVNNALEANPAMKNAWDLLAKEEQKRRIEEFALTAKGEVDKYLTFDKAFQSGRADQMLTRLPTRVGSAIRKSEHGWLDSRTKVLRVPDRFGRFSPKFLLLSKPGLTFRLHGLDANDRFDDMVKYAHGLIGNDFHLDDDVIRLRQAFVDAGATTKNPEQIRAAIVNEFQTHVLAKLAEGAGFEPEVARALGEGGMNKAETMMSALMSTEKGYMTNVIEDGVSMVLVNHPSTVRQTANFIPIMDWAGVRKALTSPDMQRLTDPEGLVSIAKSDTQKVFDAYNLKSSRDLNRFGRERATALHGIVDLADSVNNLFKMQVLLRLGYPVRNLAEGYLSATGSGIGWLNVLGSSNMEALLSNHLNNLMTTPARIKDRWMTFSGRRANETAIAMMAEQANKDLQASTDQLRRFLAVVSHDDTWNELARRAADETHSQAYRDEALNQLRLLSEWKHRLGLELDTDNASRTLYHGDRVGAIPVTHSAEGVPVMRADDALQFDRDLERPIAMTPHSEFAKAHADGAWQPIPPVPVKPAAVGEDVATGPEADWSTYQDHLVNLRKTNDIYMRQGDGAWKKYRRTKYTEGVSDTYQFRMIPKNHTPHVIGSDVWGEEFDFRTGDITELLAKFKDMDREIIHQALGDRFAMQGVNWAVDENGDQIWFHGTNGAFRPGDRISPADEFGSSNFDYTDPMAGDFADGAYVYGSSDARTSMDYAYESAKRRGGIPRLYRVKRGEPEVATTPATIRLTADESRAMEEVLRHSQMLEGHAGYASRAVDPVPGRLVHHGEYDLTIPYESGKKRLVAYVNSLIAKETDPAAKANLESALAKIEASEVMPLRGVVTKSGEKASDWDNEVMSDHWVVVDEVPQYDERAAREKVSNWLAKHGIYRAVFPDSEDWGGYQVLVHPKGIGGRGLRLAVEKEVNSMITAINDASLKRGVTPNLGLSKKRLKAANAGKATNVGTPVNPKFATTLPAILKRGGFDAVLSDAVDQVASLRRRSEMLATAYNQRMAKVEKLTKRRGMARGRRIAYKSAYGNSYMANTPLSTWDGTAYAQFATADMTTATTFGGSTHRADLFNNMYTSFLQQTDVEPTDPLYWDALANLLGRFYRDTPGAEASRGLTGGAMPMSMQDVDPIFAFAIADGDRDRLYHDAVNWALNSPEGREWVRSMGVGIPETGRVGDAVMEGRLAAAKRGQPKTRPTLANKHRLTPAQHIPWQRRGQKYADRVEVGDLIAAQFNFADNFILNNPGVKELFYNGEATAENLRNLYNSAPWELHPFNGALSPSSAEYRALVRSKGEHLDARQIMTDKIIRGMSTALRKIGSQPETRMLRHPVFERVASVDLQQRVSFAEATLGRRLTINEFNDLSDRANAFALKKMKQTLYTLESRSTLDDYLRFISPFFPAWKSAMSRWGRFYINNPANPSKIVSRANSLVGPEGLTIVDENGTPINESDQGGAYNSYIVLPVGVGSAKIPGFHNWLNTNFPGAAEMMNKTYIPQRSLDVIFQGDASNPGASPFITMPLQWVLRGRDDMYDKTPFRGIIDKLMPVGPTNTGSFWMDSFQQFMPSGVKVALNTLFKNQAWVSAYNRSYMMLYTMAQDGTYTGGTDIADDAMKLTQMMQLVKFTSAFVSPVAQQQRGDVEWYGGMYRELSDMVTSQGGTRDDAEALWYRLFPTKFMLSQSSTFNLTGGASTSAVTRNQRNNDLVNRMAGQFEDPGLLWFTDNYLNGGSLDQFNSNEYNPFSRMRQMQTGPAGFTDEYRGRKSAEQMLHDTKIKEGWIKYDEAEAQVEASMVADGIPVGSYQFAKVKQDTMVRVKQEIAKTNPVWFLAQGQIDTRKYNRNAEYFRWLVDSPWGQQRQDDQVIQYIDQYLNTRDLIRDQMKADGGAKTSTAKRFEELNAALQAQRERFSMDSPTFRQWVNRYFRNDVISVNDVSLNEE